MDKYYIKWYEWLWLWLYRNHTIITHHEEECGWTNYFSYKNVGDKVYIVEDNNIYD